MTWQRWFSCLTISAWGLTSSPLNGQSSIGVGPGFGDTAGSAFGDVYSIARFDIGSAPNAHIRFRLERVPNYFIVSPSSGTTPATILVGPNPNVIRTMQVANYAGTILFSTVDQTPAVTAGAVARLALRAPPSPVMRSVINAASLRPEVSPGGLVSVLGEGLGPPVRDAEYDGGGLYPTAFGDTTVNFNGTRVPILYVSPGRINVVAPRSIAGQSTAQVVVNRYGESATTSVSVADAAPAIFTATSNGTGQGEILNYQFPNYTPNSPDNPATPGSMIVFFATGFGVWNEALDIASISLISNPFRARPVSLMIGGLPSTIYYVGAAPYQSIGKLQVNAIVPEEVASGQQPIVLTVGEADNAAQQVTVAIR